MDKNIKTVLSKIQKLYILNLIMKIKVKIK